VCMALVAGFGANRTAVLYAEPAAWLSADIVLAVAVIYYFHNYSFSRSKEVV